MGSGSSAETAAFPTFSGGIRTRAPSSDRGQRGWDPCMNLLAATTASSRESPRGNEDAAGRLRSTGPHDARTDGRTRPGSRRHRVDRTAPHRDRTPDPPATCVVHERPESGPGRRASRARPRPLTRRRAVDDAVLFEVQPELPDRPYDDVAVRFDEGDGSEPDRRTGDAEHREVRGPVADRDRPPEVEPLGRGEFLERPVFPPVRASVGREPGVPATREEPVGDVRTGREPSGASGSGCRLRDPRPGVPPVAALRASSRP